MMGGDMMGTGGDGKAEAGVFYYSGCRVELCSTETHPSGARIFRFTVEHRGLRWKFTGVALQNHRAIAPRSPGISPGEAIEVAKQALARYVALDRLKN